MQETTQCSPEKLFLGIVVGPAIAILLLEAKDNPSSPHSHVLMLTVLTAEFNFSTGNGTTLEDSRLAEGRGML